MTTEEAEALEVLNLLSPALRSLSNMMRQSKLPPSLSLDDLYATIAATEIAAKRLHIEIVGELSSEDEWQAASRAAQ